MEGQSKTNKFSKQKKFQPIANFRNSLNKFFGKNNKPTLLKSLNKLIDNCQEHGLITTEEKKMVKNIIDIENTQVEDVMTPRTDIISISHDLSLQAVKEAIIHSEHSRLPVFKRNLDNIIGFIHSKDLAEFIACNDEEKLANFKIKDILRKILYVPHSMRIIDLLLKMRSSRVHISIVLDEYGGTDGLVSIEDIVEEIVGEIEDEHDIPDDNIYLRMKKIDDNCMQVGGRVGIDKISEFLTGNLNIEEIDSDFDTVGGLIFALFKKVPEIDETYIHGKIQFRILQADARSVKLVEISKQEN